MDMDFLNCSTEEAQVELMSMMMQMEKLSEFTEIQSPPPVDFTTTTTAAPPDQYPFYSHLSPMPPAVDPTVLPVDPAAGHRRAASVAAMREMIFRMAAMQPVHIDPESVKAPKRRNVRISKDPQSVAARHRRERISERIRILQRLVPGGTKMDTASMLDEAIHYVKFLKGQVQTLERAAAAGRGAEGFSPAFVGGFSGGNYLCFGNSSNQIT